METRRAKEINSFFVLIPFLAGLSESEKLEVSRHIIIRDFRRNETIFNEDDPAAFLYLILSGELKVSQIGPDGQEHILAVHKKGDYFGEMALLDGKTAPATVIALKESRICLLPQRIFSEMIIMNRQVINGIIDMLCLRLRQAWLQIRVMSFQDAEHRVRAVLKDLGEKFGVRDSRGTIIGLDITHQNIANLASTSRETVSRFLGRATKSGEIEVLDKKKILLRTAFFQQSQIL